MPQSMGLERAGYSLATEQNVKGGLAGGSVVKNTPANAGDTGSIPGSERPPGEGNGKPLLYSCLENPMDRGAWQATAHGVSERFGHDLATEQQQQPVKSGAQKIAR